MKIDELLAEVITLLKQEGRVSYRLLRRRFGLDDEYLEDLKAELIDAKRLAEDEDAKVLVWTGGPATPPSSMSYAAQSISVPAAARSMPGQRLGDPGAERRQLTVMFCDLVGSTSLSEHLDPEELRKVMHAYQHTSAGVIEHFAGHVAQYLGDGILVYFGYPVAYEDGAARAVRAGLAVIQALQELNQHLARPLQVRIGVHTGPVVIGEIGGGSQQVKLALGETPNIAARIQTKAEPDTVVMSTATYQLVRGLFDCRDLGPQELKDISTPQVLYQVQREGDDQNRFEVAVRTGLTPLVGRVEELELLHSRWARAQSGDGQVVLLSGEAGIGKSRLVQAFKEQVVHEGGTRIEFRCSPYHQNTALYPIIDHLQRLMQFQREEDTQTKLTKLAHMLAQYRFPQADTLPLFAALLSLPQPEGVPRLTATPQKQRQQTIQALIAWIMEEAERQPVYCSWEDLHWADPSSLELLEMALTQTPRARILILGTFRPEFIPPWSGRSYLSHITLSRLGQNHTETIVAQITGGKGLPSEVLDQIVARTDGVPLFVEELTKTVIESGLLTAVNGHFELSRPLQPLAIPATLQDSLMARLDRLSSVRELAQLGATLGREFSYEMIQAVSELDEGTLQHGLNQLVEAELMYCKGLLPQASYFFKHALVQDTAYQSLLKSKRQQYHQHIAQVFVERFPELADTQPELLAHHYTQARLHEQAVTYWQQAGQRAVERSANNEAISHLTQGLKVLAALPDQPQRAEQELMLQLPLGTAYLLTRGYTRPEVGQTYNRAYALCQQLGKTPQLIPALLGLWRFYIGQPDYSMCQQLGEQVLGLAGQSQDSSDPEDPAIQAMARYALGFSLFMSGDEVAARTHLEQGMRVYDPQHYRSPAFHSGTLDPVVSCHSGAIVLWLLGYPDQALARCQEGLALAKELGHPATQVYAALYAAWLSSYRREARPAQEFAEQVIGLCREHGIVQFLAWGAITRGWALAEQGQAAEGIVVIQQSLAALNAQGAQAGLTSWLGQLVQAYINGGQIEAGLQTVTESLAAVERNAERSWEAELYRLKGELLLNDERRLMNDERRTTQTQSLPHAAEAEACFRRAIDVARQQQTKSWELRGSMSLARLWQAQGRREDARHLLAEVYAWFTEGFETRDLQEAKILLEEITD